MYICIYIYQDGADLTCFTDGDSGELTDEGTFYVSAPGSDEWEDTGLDVIQSDDISVGEAYKCVYKDDAEIESGTVHIITSM